MSNIKRINELSDALCVAGVRAVKFAGQNRRNGHLLFDIETVDGRTKQFRTAGTPSDGARGTKNLVADVRKFVKGVYQ